MTVEHCGELLVGLEPLPLQARAPVVEYAPRQELERPSKGDHNLIVCLPALILLGVAGIVRLRPSMVGVAVAVLLPGASAWQLVGFYRRESPENWRDATHRILLATAPGDGIVFVPSSAHRPFAQPRIWVMTKGSSGNGEVAADLRRSLAENFRLAEEQQVAGVGVTVIPPVNRTQPASITPR